MIGTGTAFVLESTSHPATPKTERIQGAKPAPAGLVSGVVKGADGQPVAGAIVYLSTAFQKVPIYSDPSPKVESTVTGADGQFGFPEDPAKLVDSAKRAGLVLDGPHRALLVQGDDELGALTRVHAKLGQAQVNVYASSGVTDA